MTESVQVMSVEIDSSKVFSGGPKIESKSGVGDMIICEEVDEPSLESLESFQPYNTQNLPFSMPIT